jgi:hypothetical protein
MRFLIGLGFLLSLPLLASSTFLTQVHHIESNVRPDESSLVYLTNGRVVQVTRDQSELLDRINSGKQNKEWLKISMNGKREIKAVKKGSNPFDKFLDTNLVLEQEGLLDEYSPSIIASLADAQELFRDHRATKDGETQCYNRAEGWTYDWRTKRNVYSKKIWIFFTAKYIRKYAFEWWFHVSPMVHVNIDGQIKERVMDMKYARGPLPTKQWTDIFMKDDALCPTVSTYADHADYPESGTCFLQKTSMYFYQPADIEILEKFGTKKTAWVSSEVVQAFQEAFGINP